MVSKHALWKREWRKKNPEKVRAAHIRARGRRRPTTPEQKERKDHMHARWREQNPGRWKLLLRCAAWNRYYSLSEDDIGGMLVRQQNKCCGCGIDIDVLTCSVDHIVARARGGLNDISNYQLLCDPCNVAKSDMSMDEFVVRAMRIAEYHSSFKLQNIVAQKINA